MTTNELKEDILNDKLLYGGHEAIYGRSIEIVLSVNKNSLPLAKYIDRETLTKFWGAHQWYMDAPQKIINERCNVEKQLNVLLKGIKPQCKLDKLIENEIKQALEFVMDVDSEDKKGIFHYSLFKQINNDIFDFMRFVKNEDTRKNHLNDVSHNNRGESYEDYLKLFIINETNAKSSSSLDKCDSIVSSSSASVKEQAERHNSHLSEISK